MIIIPSPLLLFFGSNFISTVSKQHHRQEEMANDVAREIRA